MTILTTRVNHHSKFLIAKEFKTGTKYFGWTPGADQPRWRKEPQEAYKFRTAVSADTRIKGCGYQGVSFKGAFVARLDTKELHYVTTNVALSVFDTNELQETSCQN